MALQALSDAQKAQLVTYGPFISLVNFAVLDYANYWAGATSGNFVPNAQQHQWAKSFLMNPGVDSLDPIRFISFLGSTAVYDPTTNPSDPLLTTAAMDTINTYMTAQGIFQTLAGQVGLLKSSTIVM
jgi:hypothetical protein